MKRWQKMFPQRILERGEDYYRQGKVGDLEITDKEYFSAHVEGSYTQRYVVRGRLKRDGRASELSCGCPWANKGHRCKHEVAALFAADEKLYGNELPKAFQNETEISFVQRLPKEAIQRVNNAAIDDNPLKIIGDRSYSPSVYRAAEELDDRLTIANHNFEKIDNSRYCFVLDLVDGYLHFGVTIIFTTDSIETIEVNSRIRNYNTQSFEVLGLFQFINYFLRDNPTEDTNSAAHNLLMRFMAMQNENHDESPIILRAQIETNSYDHRPELFFRMGTIDHLYKVQDIGNIVEMARRNLPLKLGKFFNRIVDPNLMDEDSLKWYNFIARFVDANMAVRESQEEYYIGSFKYIPVTNSVADQVNELLQHGASLYENSSKVAYETKDINLPLNVQIDPSGNKATVEIGDFEQEHDLFRGSRNYYSFENHTWTKYDGLNPVTIKQYGFEPGDYLEFGHQTIRTLGREILPKLKKTPGIKLNGEKKLEQILPPEAKIVFQLDYQNDELICNPVVNYGDKKYQLNQKSADNTDREWNKEENAEKQIQDLGFIKENQRYHLSLGSSDKVDNFFDNGINLLQNLGKVQGTAAFKRLLGNIKTKFKVSLGIRLGENTLELKVSGEELAPEDIQAILNAYQEKKHYFMLKNGEMRDIESPSIEELADTMSTLGINLKQFVKGKMSVPAYRAFYLEKQLESREDLAFTSNDAFKKLISDLEKGKVKEVKVPASLQNILRPYQRKGFEWLSTMVNYNLGGLLADEMGLGKTLQTISVLLSREKENRLPNLIIVPASVVYNWENEIKKFAPQLTTMVLGGSKLERKAQLEKANDYDVLITSYDSLKRDLEQYENLNFDLEVIDEAQNIKNARSAASKAVKVINANHRLALTGTPIENNLSELWSIFDYLMPGFLGNYDYFRNNYEKPIVKDGDEKTEKLLGEIIAPFILRRLKKDVLKDLPDKNEEVVYANLSGKQQELYQARTQKLITQLSKQGDKDFKKQRFQVLAEITKLRELCCDPHLLYNDYRGKSAKLITTIDLIENMLTDGHKILLFSQFTSMLAIIREKLEKHKVTVFEITGSTPKEKRQELIKEFNKLAHPAVFLISLKAGGTGINLTSADVVIHYDPWWNVAAENQATDRAHRIGQKHEVQIYKIVAKDTIEEKIIDLQNKKEKLAEAVLNGENLGSTALDKDDLLKILQR